MYNIVEKKLEQPLDRYWEPIDYSEVPETKAQDYLERIDRLWRMEQAQAYSSIVIYADREHFANVHYFTGYDPRFEEALLILRRAERPIMVVGNEGLGYVRRVPIDVEVKLYQSFGLMGQPNDKSPTLTELFAGCKLPASGKVGLIGWKQYDARLHAIGAPITDVPHYIVESLCSVVGRERIQNATDLLADCAYGLKHAVSAKEIVQFELSGTKVSRGVYHAIHNLREGMTELEASRGLQLDGSPICTHPNVNFGDENVSYGLASPTWTKRLEYGEFVGVGYGLRGSLVHKCGLFVDSAREIPPQKRRYMEELVKPYYASVVRWYEMMRIGTRCGDIWQMVEDWIGLERCNVTLNPGHMIHTDEWTNSPLSRGSSVTIASGMAFQCDYTVYLNDPYVTCHVEDGLVIADAKLRAEVAAMAPKCWARIEARRALMKETLRIDLPDEVLPMSDLPAVCFPYMADTSVVLAKA